MGAVQTSINSGSTSTRYPSRTDADLQTLVNESSEMAALSLIKTEKTKDFGLARWVHQTTKGHRLDFNNHSYLVSIYEDDANITVIRKSVQSGISDRNIVKTMAAVNDGLSVFYVLPTIDIRNRFVSNRVNPLLDSVGYYRAMADYARNRFRQGREAADATGLKQLGDASIAFVGSNAPAAFREFVADIVIVDELDQCNLGNVTLARDRTGASEVRGYHVVGNPTIRGFGIDAEYQRSDQKHWNIQCSHCNEWQSLSWFDNVVREVDEGRFIRRDDSGLTCRNCERLIDRHAKGEWIPKWPDRAWDVSGYTISQLFAGTTSMAEMYTSFVAGLTNETERQRFHNSILGEPFESEGARLSRGALDKCVDDYPQQSKAESSFIGVDVGTLLHVVIIEKDRVVRICTLSQEAAFDELAAMTKTYNCRLMVIDGMPETRMSRMVARKVGQGKALLCFYRDEKGGKEFDVDWWQMKLSVDRTQSMDDSHATLLRQQIRLPRDAASIPGLFDQMMAPTRIFRKRSSIDAGRFVWDEGGNPDHYRHAFNYACLARQVQGVTRGAGIVVGGGNEQTVKKLTSAERIVSSDRRSTLVS